MIAFLINGGAGADVFFGRDGDDFVDGNRGDDLALLGAGDDVFQWDPGDGSDVVEGQDGVDTLLFNGSGASENIDISANGGRVRFFRDVAAVTMDLNDMERMDFNALGGADNIVVNDLSGTDAAQININLAAAGGGGDGQIDKVTVIGTTGSDTITVASDASGIVVGGLPAQVTLLNAEATDRLTVTGGAGADVIDAGALATCTIDLELQGGLGADLLIGSQGDDLILGGDGDDVALMGAGDDAFVWNPGDDNDTVEGQAGSDTLDFNGSGANENIDISADGGRVHFFRDVAAVTMNLDDVETISFDALGGTDKIVINDLSGTDVTEVQVNLAGTLGGTSGDNQGDTIVINGTNGDDVISIFNDNGVVRVLGLGTEVTISNFDANDRIVINGLSGDDVIDASGLGTGTADGGDGDDVLLGSDGDDILLGGAGDDVLLGGLGLDILDGGPGDNIVVQGISAPLNDFMV